MPACPSCAHENRDDARFCDACGTKLDAPAHPLAEERKIITSLFCDLVGFTATSESADPEDVSSMLAAYFAMARTTIESFGGVVEKFIGDAVVGVFGVPAAHEDDPERAVRAGLAIAEAGGTLSSVGGAPLRLRVGVNTGEALVRLSVAPGSGEGFLAGDAVNTASRLQSVAPEMGVAVGLGTYEATRQVFDYEELEPATLKGKAEPVRVFWARASRARFGTDLTRVHDSPFIGREIDLSMLKGVFEKTRAAVAPQLVTIVGEPGLGKSRIVAELFRYIEELPDFITWRQGRCLPYGEGVTFWALGEVLKAHAGILESDAPETAHAKLEVVLPEGPQREWFRQRLLPLLGIDATSSAQPEELFTAWRRFLEHVAERTPTVVVFEDLHWADPAMLAFLEHLADHADGVPLMIVGTARPELFERSPDYGRGLRNATPINLAPLAEAETARLVAALLETSVVSAELQTPLLERAGGNPLYAEEFVRLLKDRDLLVREGAGWELADGVEIPFPDSVQSLVAARLDTLAPERKAMLADAAVIGKVFWAGAVAAMGDLEEAQVAETMRELSRKELVRLERRSSMEGEVEYAFWHVLARDVAYAQLPRAAKASRHVAAASWIESRAPERLEDLADVLAYHYTSALTFAAAAGRDAMAAELEAPALRFLTLAGERALGLDTVAAVDAFQRALVLTPDGHPQRAETLARFGRAARQSARLVEAAGALEEAIALFRRAGDVLGAARAIHDFAGVLQSQNDPRQDAVTAELLQLLEPLPPSPEYLDALASVAFNETLQGAPEAGIALADRALRVAAEARLPYPVRALMVRGLARCTRGDADGLDDYRRALELALETGQGQVAALLFNNYAITLRDFEGPAAALASFQEGAAFAAVRGLEEKAMNIRSSRLSALFVAGALEELLLEAADLIPQAEEAQDEFDLTEISSIQAIALTLQGHAAEAAAHLDGLVDAARRSRRPDTVFAGIGAAVVVSAALGEHDAAAELLREAGALEHLEQALEPVVYLPAVARAAIAMGQPHIAERLSATIIRSPHGEHALAALAAALTEARGDPAGAAAAYADAAAGWGAFGALPEEGFALLGQGRCLMAMSRAAEAVEPLKRARALFSRCGLRPALEETEALLDAGRR